MKSVLAKMGQYIDREVQLLGKGKLSVYPGELCPFRGWFGKLEGYKKEKLLLSA